MANQCNKKDLTKNEIWFIIQIKQKTFKTKKCLNQSKNRDVV